MVILGAGLDSRAYRLESLRSTTVFEVDHPKVQTYKRARVAALTQVAKAVRFVGVDFEHDDLASALTAAGHDPSAPTFFLWEGVAMYLTRAAIDATLATLASRASQGSTLVLSYWVPPDDSVRGRALMLLVKSGREPIRTLVSPDELARIVAAHGFDVIRDGGTADWGSHYLGRSVSGPPERLAVAEREDRTALRKPNL
jgi:methyltransferase (TIGR00027 family)